MITDFNILGIFFNRFNLDVFRANVHNSWFFVTAGDHEILNIINEVESQIFCAVRDVLERSPDGERKTLILDSLAILSMLSDVIFVRLFWIIWAADNL